jgi:Flp pilus assembly protein CpaB
MNRTRFRGTTSRARAAQIAAVLVALLTVRLVAGDLSALQRGARAFGGSRSVVVARDDLALGASVRDRDVRIVTLPAAAVPPGALRTRADAGRPRRHGAGARRRGRCRSRARTAAARRSRRDRHARTAGGAGDRGRRAPARARKRRRHPRHARRRSVGDQVEPTVVVARAARVLSVDPLPSAHDSGPSGPDARVGVVVLVTETEAAHLADATARGSLMLALDPPEEACRNRPPISCGP